MTFLTTLHVLDADCTLQSATEFLSTHKYYLIFFCSLRVNLFQYKTPCPPIQRDSGRRSRPGVNPFISALTVARCPATFPGVWPQLRDTLSTSWSVGRGTGAFIYALSADESRPALAAPRHASTALFSCRFKCPCPPRRQRHFHGNAGRAYNTLHFASQSRVPNGGVAPFGNPHKKRRYATPPRGAYRLFLLSSPPAVSVEQKSAWD